MEQKKEYKYKQFPKELTLMPDRIIEDRTKFGYRDHAELVMDFIRKRFELIRFANST